MKEENMHYEELRKTDPALVAWYEHLDLPCLTCTPIIFNEHTDPGNAPQTRTEKLCEEGQTLWNTACKEQFNDFEDIKKKNAS